MELGRKGSGHSSLLTCSFCTSCFQDAELGPEKALGVGRVPVWPLWTILLLVRPLGGLGSPLCPREPFYFLVAIMKMLVRRREGRASRLAGRGWGGMFEEGSGSPLQNLILLPDPNYRETKMMALSTPQMISR